MHKEKAGFQPLLMTDGGQTLLSNMKEGIPEEATHFFNPGTLIVLPNRMRGNLVKVIYAKQLDQGPLTRVTPFKACSSTPLTNCSFEKKQLKANDVFFAGINEAYELNRN